VAGPVDEEADVIGRAFEDGFDAAVGQVAYPATHVVLFGHAAAAVAEEDPLDPPGHQDTVANHKQTLRGGGVRGATGASASAA
jgi:hypothetical protein